MPHQPHTRIVMNGEMGAVGAPFEIWSMGLAMQDIGDFQDPDQVRRIVDACTFYVGDLRTGIAPWARLREVALSQVGADGLQVGDTTRVPVNQAGGGNAGYCPPQIAYRVSLSSGARGRSQRGGWYVPVPRWDADQDTGQVRAQDVQNGLDSAAAFIGVLQGGANVPGRVVIPSGIVGNVPVNIVRVGRRLDTIRRRANAIPEAYLAHTL